VEVIVVKEYSEQYRDEIIDLILDIQQNEFNIPIRREDQPDLCDIPRFYHNGVGNFWIALCGKQVIGTISLLDIGDNQAALRKMFVKASYRGSGHNTAKKLLQELLEWAMNHKIKEIYLGTTQNFLAAHRFYEKNGFVQISKDSLPINFPIMKVDTKFYKYENIIKYVHDLYWEQDINCARTCILTLGRLFELEIQPQTYQAAIGLHGAGGFRAQCGLVEGALMFIGSYYCDRGKPDEEIVSLCYQFADSFTNKFGSLLCFDLRPNGFTKEDKPHLCEDLTIRAIEFTKHFIVQNQ
jgi:C_GCAxxG_C_C family probable redox protein